MPVMHLLAQAASPTPEAPALASLGNSPIVPMIFIAIIFYFLLIRPQQKKQKEHQALIAAVKTGDKVVTSGGIHGIVSNVKDATVILKVADNVKLEIDRGAIAAVTKDTANS